jgi:hypothetical protein
MPQPQRTSPQVLCDVGRRMRWNHMLCIFCDASGRERAWDNLSQAKAFPAIGLSCALSWPCAASERRNANLTVEITRSPAPWQRDCHDSCDVAPSSRFLRRLVRVSLSHPSRSTRASTHIYSATFRGRRCARARRLTSGTRTRAMRWSAGRNVTSGANQSAYVIPALIAHCGLAQPLQVSA